MLRVTTCPTLSSGMRDQRDRTNQRKHLQAWAGGVHEAHRAAAKLSENATTKEEKEAVKVAVKAASKAATKAGYESYRADHPDAPSVEELVTDPLFGDWSSVRASVGLGNGGGRRAHGDRRQARKSMQRFNAEVGPVATQEDYCEWSKDKSDVLSGAQMRRLFGHEWWRQATGLVPAMRMSRSRSVEAGPELERQLRAICRGRRLSPREYDQRRRERHPGCTSARTVSRKYGGWDRALAAAGIQ